MPARFAEALFLKPFFRTLSQADQTLNKITSLQIIQHSRPQTFKNKTFKEWRKQNASALLSHSPDRLRGLEPPDHPAYEQTRKILNLNDKVRPSAAEDSARALPLDKAKRALHRPPLPFAPKSLVVSTKGGFVLSGDISR